MQNDILLVNISLGQVDTPSHTFQWKLLFAETYWALVIVPALGDHLVIRVILVVIVGSVRPVIGIQSPHAFVSAEP
jgi:hypothetical protein